MVIGGDHFISEDIGDGRGHIVVEGKTFVMGEGGRSCPVHRDHHQCKCKTRDGIGGIAVLFFHEW